VSKFERVVSRYEPAALILIKAGRFEKILYGKYSDEGPKRTQIGGGANVLRYGTICRQPLWSSKINLFFRTYKLFEGEQQDRAQSNGVVYGGEDAIKKSADSPARRTRRGGHQLHSGCSYGRKNDQGFMGTRSTCPTDEEKRAARESKIVFEPSELLVYLYPLRRTGESKN
jgi:hypothetical protein